MGYWGDLPWDNDYAGDWFDTVFEKSKIHELIGETLSKDVTDYTRDEIRGAITLFIFLGRTYVYDIEIIDDHLDLAIAKGKELINHWSDGGWDGDEEFGEYLKYELEILEYRKRNTGVSEDSREPIRKKVLDYWATWLP